MSSQDLTIVAQGGATPTPSGDTDPPQLDTLEFFDTDANGKVDEVVATFTDASDLAPYTAGTDAVDPHVEQRRPSLPL